MADYKLGNEYYMLGYSTEVFTLVADGESASRDGMPLYEFQCASGEKVILSSNELHYKAVLASSDNYRMLGDLVKGLEASKSVKERAVHDAKYNIGIYNFHVRHEIDKLVDLGWDCLSELETKLMREKITEQINYLKKFKQSLESEA